MKQFSPKTFHRVVAATLATAMCCAIIPFSAFASDGISELLHVDGNKLYANGQPLTIADAPNGQDSMLYIGDTLVSELTIAGDSDGTDGYDLSDVAIFAGSQHAIDPSATTAAITVTGGNVGSIYAGGEALLTTDISAELDAMRTALEAALAALTLTETELSDETIASLNTVIATLEAMLAEFEADYTTSTQSINDVLAALAALETAITAEIAPYLAAESQQYLGEVGALLLADVEAALTSYIDALEARLTQKLENALYATLLDALCIVFGVADMTEEDLANYQAAIENLSTVLEAYEAYEAAQAETAAAKAAWLARTSVYTGADLETFVAEKSQTVTIPFVGSTTYRLTLGSFATDDSDDGYAILTAWKNGEGIGVYGDYYTYSSNSTTAGFEYGFLSSLYADFLSSVDEGDGDSDESLTELLADYTAAASTEAAALITLTSAVTSAYDDIALLAGLLGVEPLTWDDITDLDAYIASLSESLANASATIAFITELATLISELSAGGDATEIISAVYTLISESGMSDDLQAILLAALENLYDEFNAAYLQDELGYFTEAMLGALETLDAQLGTEGYPNDLEGQLCEMLSDVLATLKATGADATITDAIEALLTELTTTEGALSALTDAMYADILAYLVTTEKISTSAIKNIILDTLLPALEASFVELMSTEVAVLSSVSITVTGGTIGTLYASGAGAGFVASGVAVCVSGGSIGALVNDMPTTADEAAAALTKGLCGTLCKPLAGLIGDALANFTAPVVGLTGGTYTVAPDAACIPFGYTLTKNPDGTFTIANTMLDDANDLLADLDDLLDVAPDDFTAEQREDLFAAIENIASLEKETLASDEAVVEKLNALDALYLAAINADDSVGSLTVDATVAANAIETVTVEGLASAVYGSAAVALPDTDTSVTLSLAVAQIEIDTDADVLAELDEATLATVFAFSAKPTISTTTADASSTTPIENDDIYSPITFSVYLSAAFPAAANDVTVVHYFSADSAQTDAYEILTCKVLTDANGARYIKITVTEFSNFMAIPLVMVEDENNEDNNDNNNNGGSNGSNSGSNNSGSNSGNTEVYYEASAPDTVTPQTTPPTGATVAGTTGTTSTTDTTEPSDTADAADTTVTTTPATDENTPAEDTTPDASIEDALVAVPSTTSGVLNVLLCLFAVLVLAGALVFVVLKRRSQQAED